jgi:hypothetical protein
MRAWGALGLALLSLAGGTAATAAEACAVAPYADAPANLSALVQRLVTTLEPFPSLSTALFDQAPTICLSDELVEEQGYYEPKSGKIVLNSLLEQDFQLAILIHEVRHLEQFGRGSCPAISYRMSDYVAARLALEADAAAIGVYVAWILRQSGDPGPWEMLKTWHTHDDLVARFEEEIDLGGDEVVATSATFAQWYESADRREIYTFAICMNYLDELDRKKVNQGAETLPEDFAERLCVMPDNRPYTCAVRP